MHGHSIQSQADRFPALMATLVLGIALSILCLLAAGSPAVDRAAHAQGRPSPSIFPRTPSGANSLPRYTFAYTAYLPSAVSNWQAPTEVFTVGILGPFSSEGQIGAEFNGAVTMALEAIQWQIGPYRIQPVWIDSQSDPILAAQAYSEAIIRDGVQAGLLNWSSSVALECMEVTADHQVPHFFGLGASPGINDKFASDPDRYGYWTTKGWPVTTQLLEVYVEALDDAIDSGLWSPTEKTVAIYGEDTSWGRSAGEAFQAHFERAGWTTVAKEYLAADTVDFSAVIGEFVSVDPAAVVGAAPGWLPLFLQEAERAQLRSLIIADGLSWWPDWYQTIGNASDYVLDQVPLWPTAEARAFAQDFETRWGVTPHPYAAGLVYDGTRFFVSAAQSVYDKDGLLSSEALHAFAQDQIWTGKWTFQDGIMVEQYAYTPETVPDPLVGEGYYTFPIVQYFEGEGKIIFPASQAEQPFTPPGE